MARNSRQPRRNNHPSSVKLLQRLENGLDAFVDASVDAFLLFDDNLDLMSINPAGERLFGVSKEMVVGKNIVELEPDIKETGKYDKYLDVMKTGDLFFVEEPFSHPKFGDMRLSIKAFKVREGLGMIVNDITERRRMEKALRESELVATATIEGMADGVMLVNMEGKVTYVNKAFEKLLGHKADEVVGTSALELPTYRGSKDRERAREALKMLMEKGSTKSVDMTAITKDGVEIPISFNASMIKDAKGDPKTLVAVIRDVTERKKAGEALRSSEEKLRLYLDNSPDAIYTLDAMGNFLYGNMAAEKVVGYSREEILGRNFVELSLLSDEQLLKAAQLHELNLAGKPTGPQEYELIRKDGSRVFVEISTYPVGEGDNLEVIGIARDTTERRKMEEELRRLSDAVKMSTDSIVVTDMQGQILDANEAALRMHGANSKADFIGRDPFAYIQPEDRKKALGNMAKVMETGYLKDIQYHILTNDGRNILIETSISVIKGSSGEPKGLVAVARDITERRSMEEALRHSEEYFRALTENMSDAIAVLDADGIVRYEGHSMDSVLGYKAGERAGTNGLDFVHQDDIQNAAEDLATLIQHPGSSMRKELRVKHNDGSWRTADITATNLLDNPAVGGIVINFRDITERMKAQEALKQSEKKYRQLFESMQEGLWLIDKDSITTFVNPRMAEILGYTAEEMLGKHLFEFMDERGTEVAKYNLERRRQGIKEQHDFEFTRKDGARVYASLETSPIVDEKGNYIGALACVADITTRKEAEEALRVSEERYRLVVENASEAILVAQDGMSRFFNTRAIEIFGYSREEVASKPFIEFVHSEDQAMVAGRYMERLEGKEVPPVYSFRVVDKTGNVRWVEISAVAINWEGRPASLNFLTDITERKKAEEFLRESEERFRAIFDNSVDGILVTDLETNSFYTCNKAMCQMLGYNLEEIRNLKVTDIHPKKDLPYVVAEMERERQGKSPAGVKVLPLVRKDGSVLHAEVTPSLVTFAGRQYLAGIFRDISERRKAEEEKQRMEEQLRLAGRLAAVGELAAGVAHELNNPLAAIQGYAQFLSSSSNLDVDTKKDVETIYREALRASKITQNLLSFARRHEPEKGFVSLNEVIEKTTELRAHQMKVSNIELLTELAPDLPKTMVDFYQMQQVFVNLINNAEQAMVGAHGKGKLVIKTQKSDEVIRVTFTDDGPGISEENMKRIFDPFFTTKDVGKGTGLGLPICYGIVEAHGGRIYAKSKLGAGATFVVEIPIVAEGQ